MIYDRPVWTQQGRAPRQYPWLDEDAQAEVCVIGGGVTGALCALRLARAGVSVILLTRGQIGYGATASMMPCAPCDLGESLRALGRRVGRETAAGLYRTAAKAADTLGALCSELEPFAAESGGRIGFSRRDSLVYVDSEDDVDQLERECTERQRARLDCTVLGGSATRDAFPFPAAGAILMKEGAVELDPYRLTHAATAAAAAHGARIFENTRAERLDTAPDGGVEVTTGTFRRVRAKTAVVAAGAATAGLMGGLLPARTRYMAVSQPVRSLRGWPGRCVIRSFAAPQMTCATSPEGRIFISSPATTAEEGRIRLGDALRLRSLHGRRLEELEEAVRYMFPEVYPAPFEFGQVIKGIRTSDGLPVLGRPQSQPGCIFAVGCGEGGLLMSEAISRMAAVMAVGGEPEDAEAFSPDRRRLAG